MVLFALPARAEEAPAGTGEASTPGEQPAPAAPPATEAAPPPSSAAAAPAGDSAAPAGDSAPEPPLTEPAPAEDMPADSGFEAGVASGSLRTSYWTSNRKLNDEKNLGSFSLWMRATPRLGQHASIVAEGWVRHDNVFRNLAATGLLREAYLDLSLGALDLRVGRQIIVWGRADGVNPTDNVSPRDFTLLVPEDDDQRYGAYAVKSNLYLGSFTLSGLWLPGFQPHTVPVPPLPAIIVAHETAPSKRRALAQSGFKLEQTGKAVDWSLSYFNGYDKYPDFELGSASMTQVDVLLRHHRVQVVGGDFATVLGRFGVRGEASYTFTKDSDGTDPQVKNPFLFLVLGIDRTFGEYLNINAQYLLRAIARFEDPFQLQDPLLRQLAVQGDTLNNQLDRVQQGGSLRIHDRWYNETLEAELLTVFWLPRFNYALRGRVSYAFSDRWKGTIGADYFNGESPSFFRVFEKNTTAYAEVRLGF